MKTNKKVTKLLKNDLSLFLKNIDWGINKQKAVFTREEALEDDLYE